MPNLLATAGLQANCGNDIEKLFLKRMLCTQLMWRLIPICAEDEKREEDENRDVHLMPTLEQISLVNNIVSKASNNFISMTASSQFVLIARYPLQFM